eukprot:TRINITY_DN19340_c0_g1_i7.p1 TRINITY_DN19340_c0_g1~~TRINITY_DN19340_c0_g1_i7.p1  ORF type:complete len:271 (-),score=30.83 TRINITY_DN19340_c0_g1_i7:308-1120(-)
MSVVWQASDGVAFAASGPCDRPSPDLAAAGGDGAGGKLPASSHKRSHPEHRIYPYLLRNLEITRPNPVCADVTYLPMRRGFLYLVAIMDWASRKVLAWRLSNTMDAGFCVEALEDALARFGKPEIFSTDQRSQFTSNAFIVVLRAAGISMDGRGRWMDTVFIERLWRSVKYECVYLHAFETGSELRDTLGRWFAYYDNPRPHSRLAGKTLGEAYGQIGASNGGMNNNQELNLAANLSKKARPCHYPPEPYDRRARLANNAMARLYTRAKS